MEYYFSLDLQFISHEQSKYCEDLKLRNTPPCPIGVLDDIEIVFLHYHSEEEAYTKWNRRKERIDINNVIVKMSEQNHCTCEHLNAFDALPYKTKFVWQSVEGI